MNFIYPTSLSLLLLSILSGLSGPAASESYRQDAGIFDAGGLQAQSGSYMGDASFGIFVGQASSQNGTAVSKNGYVGQLYEVKSLTASTRTNSVHEGTNFQLNAFANLDDGTLLSLTSYAQWSVTAGPVDILGNNGLAKAQSVYADTPAIVRAIYQNKFSDLGLTILNVDLDDYGIYSHDGIPDLWQVQKFGINSSAGVASADPDGDGQSNLQEFFTITDPSDANSKFRFSIQHVAGPPAQENLVFSPRFTNRSYAVEYGTNLESKVFYSFTNGVASDAGSVRTISDANSLNGAKFFRVKVALP
jgi:hypothetical protein